MALTEAQIQIDFKAAIQQAEKLEGIAERMNILAADKFDTTLQDIAANWKGDSASSYLKKAGLVQTKMKASADDLNTVAGEIRSAAKRMYDAEMTALTLIATKS